MLSKLRFLTPFFALLSAFAAPPPPVMIDLDFDGHLDRLIVRREHAFGSEYDVQLYDPGTGEYRRNEMFSQYIVGLTPETCAETATIRTILRIPGCREKMPGYKFSVRDGKLCFVSGRPLPEKFPGFPDKPTAEIIRFDREAAGAEYLELEAKWCEVKAKLLASGIPADRENAARFYLDGQPVWPEGCFEWESTLEKLRRLPIPPELPSRFYDDAARRARDDYLGQTASLTTLLEAMLPTLDRRRKPLDLKEMLVNQIFDYSGLRQLVKIFAMRMAARAESGDIDGAIADFKSSGALAGRGFFGTLDAMVTIAMLYNRLDALAIVLETGSARNHLQKHHLIELEKLLIDEEARLCAIADRSWRTECAVMLDTADGLLAGEADPGSKSFLTPDGRLLNLLAVPLLRDKIFYAEEYRRFIVARAKVSDPRTLPFADPEKRSSGSLLTEAGAELPKSIRDLFEEKVLSAVARIRAARAALRKLGLEAPEASDPFTGRPLKQWRGELQQNGQPRTVVRFYSVGADGKDDCGRFREPDGDDVSFDLFELPAM